MRLKEKSLRKLDWKEGGHPRVSWSVLLFGYCLIQVFIEGVYVYIEAN